MTMASDSRRGGTISAEFADAVGQTWQFTLKCSRTVPNSDVAKWEMRRISQSLDRSGDTYRIVKTEKKSLKAFFVNQCDLDYDIHVHPSWRSCIFHADAGVTLPTSAEQEWTISTPGYSLFVQSYLHYDRRANERRHETHWPYMMSYGCKVIFTWNSSASPNDLHVHELCF